MVDPLTEVVTLLQPRAAVSKVVSGAGRWRVRRQERGLAFYCVVLEGHCLLSVDAHEPLLLQAGDFVLMPLAYGFSVSSPEPLAVSEPDSDPVQLPDGSFRLGAHGEHYDALWLVGHCTFSSPDAALLVTLLPRLVHVRGEPRLATLVQLVGEESRAWRPARDVILTRLLEVLLIEALRSGAGSAASPGLLRGLADPRLAVAIRAVHEHPEQAWTVLQLAQQAALSRSAFFERFSRAVGIAPMEYVLSWRMALAKRLLRRPGLAIADVAERVGYSSASTFSVAFTRHIGMAPARYARQQDEPEAEPASTAAD